MIDTVTFDPLRQIMEGRLVHVLHLPSDVNPLMLGATRDIKVSVSHLSPLICLSMLRILLSLIDPVGNFGPWKGET